MVTKKELDAIKVDKLLYVNHMAFIKLNNGWTIPYFDGDRLDDYDMKKSNKLNSIHVYIVCSIILRNRLRIDGFVTPVNFDIADCIGTQFTEEEIMEVINEMVKDKTIIISHINGWQYTLTTSCDLLKIFILKHS